VLEPRAGSATRSFAWFGRLGGNSLHGRLIETFLDSQQDRRAIKRRCVSMADFKSLEDASITVAGIAPEGLSLANSRPPFFRP
jgi:hypothetical protein